MSIVIIKWQIAQKFLKIINTSKKKIFEFFLTWTKLYWKKNSENRHLMVIDFIWIQNDEYKYIFIAQKVVSYGLIKTILTRAEHRLGSQLLYTVMSI